jgi:flagellar basal body rod protein FlgG
MLEHSALNPLANPLVNALANPLLSRPKLAGLNTGTRLNPVLNPHNQGSSFSEGLMASTRSMAAELKTLEVHTNNIAHFGIPGFQRQEVIRRRFVEYLGPETIETVRDQEVGRIRQTGFMTDLALTGAGAFHTLNPQTGALLETRDGRTTVDKEGYLRTLAGHLFLDDKGQPLRFSSIPTNFEQQVRIDKDGLVTYRNHQTGEAKAIGRMGLTQGTNPSGQPSEVAQGYQEDSNVMLAKEFTAMVVPRRQFEANRQFFLMQSETLSKIIQELGRAQ